MSFGEFKIAIIEVSEICQAYFYGGMQNVQGRKIALLHMHFHTHAHTRTHARTHARTNARPPATHPHTSTHHHTHTHTHTHPRTPHCTHTHAHTHTHTDQHPHTQKIYRFQKVKKKQQQLQQTMARLWNT